MAQDPSSADRVRCAFIGLGSQGAPIARRMIDAGFPTTLWARRPDSLAPFAGSGAHFAETVADLAAQADHIGVCVVDDAGVQEICDQLIPHMREGSRIAIHSTVHPDTCTDVARKAADKGVDVVDAPVSGGRIAAEAGALTVMVGGERAIVEKMRPVFETFGKLIVHLGSLGAGQQAKLINNALMAAHMGIAHRAVAVGGALGIDPAALTQLVSASSGQSYGFDVYARLPSVAEFRHGALLLRKDTRLLQDLLGTHPDASAIAEASEAFLDEVIASEPPRNEWK